MAAAAGDLLADFPELFPETGDVALEVDGTGFSILLGAETGRASGGLCLGEGGVAWSRIVSGSSWRTMADCGGVCASALVAIHTIPPRQEACMKRSADTCKPPSQPRSNA